MADEDENMVLKMQMHAGWMDDDYNFLFHAFELNTIGDYMLASFIILLAALIIEGIGFYRFHSSVLHKIKNNIKTKEVTISSHSIDTSL